MIRSLIIISILFFTDCQQSKKEQRKISTNNSDCNKGINEANADLKLNVLGLYFFGLPNPRLNTHIRILAEEYMIKIKGGGDVVTEEGKCYNEIMEIKIKERFGKNIFDSVIKKVDSLYNAGVGDRELQYMGGAESMNKFLACKLNFFDLKESEQNKPTVFINLIIDSDGNISNASVKRGVDDKYDSEALRVSKLMTGWIPAIQNKKAVESQMTIRVKFDPSIRKNIDCNYVK